MVYFSTSNLISLGLPTVVEVFFLFFGENKELKTCLIQTPVPNKGRAVKPRLLLEVSL